MNISKLNFINSFFSLPWKLKVDSIMVKEMNMLNSIKFNIKEITIHRIGSIITIEKQIKQ